MQSSRDEFPPLGIAKLIRKTQWALSLRLRYRPDDDEESRARRVNPTEITFVQLLFSVLYIYILYCYYVLYRFKYTYVYIIIAWLHVGISKIRHRRVLCTIYFIPTYTSEQYVHIYNIKFHVTDEERGGMVIGDFMISDVPYA